jgi:hypothetical protein
MGVVCGICGMPAGKALLSRTLCEEEEDAGHTLCVPTNILWVLTW